ncbi:MAG: hypothetical protein EFT35_10520 [Methanophagales archaeon ANME-1-THS]|nr:MAG: hypothetical protein EFT35_10520 [Methanophagales archaeon ANME-1-THS]
MDLLKKMRPGSEYEDLAGPPSHPEGGEGMGMANSTEEELFEDDKEMEQVREWWLQSDAEEMRDEEPQKVEFKEEELKGEEAQEEPKREEPELEAFKVEEPKAVEQRKDQGEVQGGGADALISSLREDLTAEDEEETNIVLKEAMEELGNVSAAELLELGVATLRALTERTT